MGAADVKRGVVGAAGIVLTVVFVGLLGPAGLLAGMCALFLGALDEPGALSERLVMRARFVAVGALVVGLLSWSGDDVWPATVVATIVTYLGTLAAGWGPSAGAQGQSLVLLAVVTLMIGPTDLAPLELAFAYVAGGLIATAVSLVAWRWTGGDDAPEEAADPPVGGQNTVREVVRSEIGVFALVRAMSVAIATALGYEFFGSHPVWAMLTVVLVLQTPARQTLSVGLQRTVGTIVGVLAGMVIVRWLDTGTVAIVAAFVLAGFGMIAFKGVSYTLSTVFTTCVLLFSQRILQEDAFETGWQRIGATLLGTAIALAVVFLAVTRDRHLHEQG